MQRRGWLALTCPCFVTGTTNIHLTLAPSSSSTSNLSRDYQNVHSCSSENSQGQDPSSHAPAHKNEELPSNRDEASTHLITECPHSQKQRSQEIRLPGLWHPKSSSNALDQGLINKISVNHFLEPDSLTHPLPLTLLPRSRSPHSRRAQHPRRNSWPRSS